MRKLRLQEERQKHASLTIQEFLNSKKYLGGSNVWPHTFDTLVELDQLKPREIVLPWGIGSGKSMIGALYLLWQCYKILPAIASGEFRRTFDIAGEKPVLIFVLATKAEQARDNIFAELQGAVLGSPWFAENYPVADYKHKVQFTQRGKPLPLVVQPLGASPRGPLAYDCYGCAVDEAGWWIESGGKTGKTAEEINNTIDSRMTSRFLGAGVLMNLSAPKYVGDFVQVRAKEIEDKPDPRCYTSRRAVWECKPQVIAEVERGEGRELPHPETGAMVLVPSSLLKHFDRNPELAWRDFGGVPSAALEAFDPTAAQFLEACATLEHLPAPDPASTYFVHGDLALTSDACAVAMAHLRSDGVAQLDRLVIIEKDPATGEVEIEAVRQQILRWRDQRFGIQQCSFDQFQSADLMQRLRGDGLKAERISVDATVEAYLTLKGRIHEGTFAYWPGLPHVEKFCEEYTALELVRGKKVDHAPNRSKDLSDAVAGAVHEATVNSGLVWNNQVTF